MIEHCAEKMRGQSPRDERHTARYAVRDWYRLPADRYATGKQGE
jgi:hypothetical protein